MPIPWFRILDAVLGVTDLALARRVEKRLNENDDAKLMAGRSLGHLETRLAGVVVAALKEAFERDSRRLDLEREQAEAERLRAERALRLELLRQTADREVARLRLVAAVAVASWLGTLFFSPRIFNAPVAARALLGAGWISLLAGLGASFMAQSAIATTLARIDPQPDESLKPSTAGLLAPWLIVLGLGLVGVAALLK